MRIFDIIQYSVSALWRHPMRTVLILIAMSIGVSAIVVLTSLGEGARRFVVGEFASLGTHLIIVLPGRSETAGGGLSILVGQTPRELTLDDAVAVSRSYLIKRIAPIVIGEATVNWRGRERDVPVLGSSHELKEVRQWNMAQGMFLPKMELDRASPVCVIGTKIKSEIFGLTPALGEWLRIGDRRFRVIGVLASEGRSIGMDVEELVIVPTASAQTLFNTNSLFRLLVETKSREAIPKAIKYVETTLEKRHQGERDVTVITQDAVLATFDKILQALTLTVAGIAAISLSVAGILIMNVMLVSVSQRTSEIGLLKALGTSQRQIVILFLTEAFLLSVSGAALGMILGQLANWFVAELYPDFPVGTPMWAMVASIAVAVITGIVFGAMPARRAARLDPVEALAHK